MNASKPGTKTFQTRITQLFKAFDDESLAALGHARELSLAARALTDLEAVRLARKLGGDAPRVQALKMHAAGRVKAAQAIEVEAQIAAVRVPRVTASDTLLHGRVTDAGLNRVVGAAVRLVDEHGEPVPGVKEARTDEQGYYAFVLGKEQAEALVGARLSVTVANGDARIRPAQPLLEIEPGVSVVHEVRLTDDDLARLKLRLPPRRTRPKKRSRATRAARAPARRGRRRPS